MVPPLPVELYLLILERLEWKDLHNLLLVCRDFHLPAEKALYRNIHHRGQTQPSHLRLFQTIISNERVANHILSLTISSPSANFVTAETYWSLLTQTLYAARNLERFYWLARKVTCPPTLHLFSGCTLQLRTLVFHASYAARITLDKAFLDLQTELVELDFPAIPAIPTTVFPKLTTLTVSCRGTARLIDRPRLRAICSAEPTLVSMAQWPTSNIITSIRIRLSFVDQFLRVIRRCPCLRFLQIDNIALTYLAPSRDYQWDRALEYLFTQIDHLTSLEKLCLHFSFNPFEEFSDELIMNMHERAFMQLRSLQEITVEGHLTDICVRWLKGTDGEEIVERNEEEWRDTRWQ